MEFLQQMAAHMLLQGELDLCISGEVLRTMEGRCFGILERIRQILADDTLDDPECFQRIEQIVCILEENGIDCGTRHDFG